MKTRPTPETDDSKTRVRKNGFSRLIEYCYANDMAKLERERDELKRWTSVNGVIDLQRERDEAREELSEWRILNGWGGTPEIINDFIKGQQTRIHHAQDLEAELAAVTAQRDRLAEALRECLERLEHHTEFGALVQADMSAMHSSREALQSLTPNV